MKILTILLLAFPVVAQNYDGSNFIASSQSGRYYATSKLAMYCDFETSADGTVVTVPILNASCHVDPALSSAAWSIVGALGVSGVTISTAAQAGPTTAQFVAGTPYLEGTGGRGLAWKITDIGSSSRYKLTWSWNAASPPTVATAFGWVKFPYKSTNVTSHETSTLGYIGNSAGDFATAQSSFGKAYLETSINPNGAASWCTGSCDANGFFDYAADTWYGFEVEMHTYPEPYHFYRVYSCVMVGNRCTVGQLLHASAKATNAAAAHVPTNFTLSLDDETDTNGPLQGLVAYIDSVRVSLSGTPIYP